MRRLFYFYILITPILFCGMSDCNSQVGENNDFTERRLAMVRFQIKGRGVSDKLVLEAMRKVERHKFVLPRDTGEAYDDHPLPIGFDQTISQPYIVALMTELLELEKNSKVLEIGTGSGYQAAVLAEICDSVFTIEVIQGLGERTQKLFHEELEYKNIFMKIGDGYQGWPENAPFDAIIVTCAPTKIPEALKKQLREGGRMVIPYGDRYAQKLAFLTKQNGKIVEKNVIGVRFVPMIDKDGKKY